MRCFVLYAKIYPAWIKSIYAETPVTTAAGTTGAALVIHTSGAYHCRVNAPVGPIYVTPLSTAPLTSNALKIASSGYLELVSQNRYIALYSTSTGATYELVLFQ